MAKHWRGWLAGWLYLSVCAPTWGADTQALIFDFNVKNLSDSTEWRQAISNVMLVSVPTLEVLGRYEFGESVAGAFFEDGGLLVTGAPQNGDHGHRLHQKLLFFPAAVGNARPKKVRLQDSLSAWRFFTPYPEIFLSGNGLEVALMMRPYSNHLRLLSFDEQGTQIGEIPMTGPLEAGHDFVLWRHGRVLMSLFKQERLKNGTISCSEGSGLLLVDQKDGHVVARADLGHESGIMIAGPTGSDQAYFLLGPEPFASGIFRDWDFQLATVSMKDDKLNVVVIPTDLKIEANSGNPVQFCCATTEHTVLAGIGDRMKIRTLYRLDCATGKVLQSQAFAEPPTSFGLSADYRFLVTTDPDTATVRVLDAGDFHEVNTSKEIVAHPLYVICK